MTTYFYRARRNSGRLVVGLINARGKMNVALALKAQGLYTVSVYECPSVMGNVYKHFEGSGPGKSRLAFFCRQLATMLGAGVNLDRSLEILAERVANKKFNQAIISVQEQIRKGSSFSRALKGYPLIFPEVMVNMVEAAELGGTLPDVIDDIAGYLETENLLAARLKSVMIYPVFLFMATSLLIAGMVAFVIPKYLTAFQQLHITPPVLTMLVVKAGHVAGICWPWLFGAVLVLGGFYRRIYNTAMGCKVIMGLPVAGRLIKNIAIARYCGVLGMLLERGVPFVPALEISGRVSGNVVLKAAGERLIGGLIAGSTLTRVMALDTFFPSLVIQMVKVGEETGELGDAFSKTALFYRRETEVAVKNILTTLEPLFILFMGGVIGILVVALLLPMISLINSI